MSLAGDMGLIVASLAYSAYENYKSSPAYGERLYKTMMRGRKLQGYDFTFFPTHGHLVKPTLEREMRAIGRSIVALYEPIHYGKYYGFNKDYYGRGNDIVFAQKTEKYFQKCNYLGTDSLMLNIANESIPNMVLMHQAIYQDAYDRIKKNLLAQREAYPFSPDDISFEEALEKVKTDGWSMNISYDDPQPPTVQRTPEEIEYFDKVVKRIMQLTAWALEDLRDWSQVNAKCPVVSPELALRYGMMPADQFTELFQEYVVDR